MLSSIAVLVESYEESINDEAVLIQEAQKNPLAFEQIYIHYRQRVYAYLRIRTHTEEDAADLTQQVFLQALTALPRYRAKQVTFGAWLFRIAHNAVIDFYRRQKTSIPWDEVAESDHPMTDASTETYILHQEAVRQVRDLLTTVDEETRELLLLRFAAQLTAAEISIVIGKSIGATQKRLSRALQSLKEHYYASC